MLFSGHLNPILVCQIYAKPIVFSIVGSCFLLLELTKTDCLLYQALNCIPEFMTLEFMTIYDTVSF